MIRGRRWAKPEITYTTTSILHQDISELKDGLRYLKNQNTTPPRLLDMQIQNPRRGLMADGQIHRQETIRNFHHRTPTIQEKAGQFWYLAGCGCNRNPLSTSNAQYHEIEANSTWTDSPPQHNKALYLQYLAPKPHHFVKPEKKTPPALRKRFPKYVHSNKTILHTLRGNAVKLSQREESRSGGKNTTRK